jgi:hypothetical protein
MSDYPEHDDYEEDRSPENDFEMALSECGIGPDGYCGYAGSEYCDWDCPLTHHMSDTEIAEWVHELSKGDDHE